MLRSNVQIHDNGFIFAYDLGMTFTTNRSGVEILKMMQQGLDREVIRTNIRKMFTISDLEFEKDFQDFVAQLRHLQLMV